MISSQFLGIENFGLWSRSEELDLLGGNKICPDDITCAKVSLNGELRKQWERVNVIVLLWILNSLSKSSIFYLHQSYEEWSEIKIRRS